MPRQAYPKRKLRLPPRALDKAREAWAQIHDEMTEAEIDYFYEDPAAAARVRARRDKWRKARKAA